MSASYRHQLLRIIKIFILLLIAGFLFVLFKVGSWTPATNQLPDTSGLLQGQTAMFKVENKPYWVSRFSSQQLKKLATLKDHIHNGTGCKLEQALCWVTANTNRQGVLIRYSKQKPSNVKANQPWYGGFVNPANGAVYDLLGRGYLSNPIEAEKSIQVPSIHIKIERKCKLASLKQAFASPQF